MMAKHSWEEAVDILRKDPRHHALIRESYLTTDLADNCRRFHASAEFKETLRLVRKTAPHAKRLLDVPAGNGIASYAFAREGYDVVAVEPDPSPSVGRGAIERIEGAARPGSIRIVAAHAESLPFDSEEVDVVYVRQGLHHARDLRVMARELARVLRRDGVLLASREHVVDDYDGGLRSFLDAQPDHQLYGGENAFLLDDYLAALRAAGLKVRRCLGPCETIINLHPDSQERIDALVLGSRTARRLRFLLPRAWLLELGRKALSRRNKEQGRLYTFLATKA